MVFLKGNPRTDNELPDIKCSKLQTRQTHEAEKGDEALNFFPKTLYTFTLYGVKIEITETVVVTWFIIAGLALFSIIAGKNLKNIPDGFQNFVELLVESIEWLVKTTMGEKGLGFTAYIGTLTVYLAVANLIGLITLRQPTADLSTTLALAVITFFLTQYYGIKEKGFIKYLKSFAEPLPFMLPLNIIGELANPFSMAFRLFGNILGGYIIMALVYRIVPFILPIPLHLYFDIFAGILQTFIFSMLTMTFVSMAMD